MKATVITVIDGIPQPPEVIEAERIIAHIHDDLGPHKRATVLADGTAHLYSAVLKITREEA